MTELERRLAAARRQPVNVARLKRALVRRAADEGLLDVAYGVLDSPLGRLTIFVTRRGLVRLSYPDEPVAAQLEELASRVSPRILAADETTDGVRRQLEAYFAGRLRRFDVAIDWALVQGFAAGVLRATAEVPYGMLTSYRDVATAAGSPRAARAAGNALGSNPIPIVVPCHRVVHAGGGIGGYTGGLARKRFLLELEGSLPS